MGRVYTAFISYRHARLDSAAAEMIHKRIERYRVPKKLRAAGDNRFGYVFRDREELPVSSDLSADIRAALDASDHLIVICTPETKKSPWVEREIAYFLQHHDRCRVFAVLAAGEPNEVFPQILTEVDGIPNAVEPLALDIRADSENGMRRRLRHEIFRLYAALIGCPYDALVLRHQKRKFRRVTAAAAAILAVVTAFSGMLLVKNQQLAEQKAQVQLRESELLVQNARESLRKEDYVTAAMQAAAALPAGENERPYVAEAEQVLIEALGIFDDGRKSWFQTRTSIALAAPAADLCISEGGNSIAVVDSYGAVRCYDAKTGEKLWEKHLDTEKGDALLPGADGTLIAVGGGQMMALDWENGEKRWTYENNHMAGHVVSANKTKIALLERRFAAEGAGYEFGLVILAADTGGVLCNEKIAAGALTEPTEELPYVVLQETLGAFSPDGSIFAGCYGAQTADGDELICYTADVKTGKVKTLCARDLPDGAYSCALTQLFVTEDAVFSLYRMANSAAAVRAEKLDLATGKLKWETVTPAEDTAFGDHDPVRCLLTESKLYIARGNAIYTVDAHTGAAVRSGTLNSDVFSMRIVDERYLIFLTADGDYTLGWKNENGIFNSGEVFDASLQLGSIKKAALRGGALQAVADHDKISDVTAVEAGSFVAAVPENDESTVIIHRVCCPGDISGEVPAEVPESVWTAENVKLADDAHLPVPLEAVRQAQYLLDGKCLLIKTDARKIYIIDGQSGATLFEDRSVATATGKIQVFEDAAGSRIYLADDFSRQDAGLCIDIRTWTNLAEIPGFVCYDTEKDAIYRVTDSGETVRCRLPATEELVRFTVAAFAP